MLIYSHVGLIPTVRCVCLHGVIAVVDRLCQLHLCSRAGEVVCVRVLFFFFSSRRRHTRCLSDWSSDVCSSDLAPDAASSPVMKPSLQLRLSQHLALTPQLQQSIRLLQLSTLELQQEVEQMLDQNPFLEAEEEGAAAEGAGERTANAEPPADAPVDTSSDREAAYDSGDEAPGIDNTDFAGIERNEWENGTEGDDFDGIRELPSVAASAAGSDDDQEAQDRTAAAPSLQDHLRGQLALMRLSPEDRAAVWALIESLDADGYLADSLEEIAERLGAADIVAASDAGVDGNDLLERLHRAR